MATHVAAHACAPCRATLSALRSVGGGPSQALSERHGNHSARCPGLLGALGSRTPPRATGGEGHHAACRLPHSVLSPDGARALPRVYVYTFMDSLHDQLVRLRSSEHIFDPWHQQNQARAQPCSRLADLGREPFRRSLFAQFLSEYAFHRSLVASSLVTADPAKASLYFVPFYSRMAFSNRSIRALMLSALEAGLGASPFWRRSRGRDHAFVISSTRPMEQLFGPQANAVTCRYMPLHAVTCRYTPLQWSSSSDRRRMPLHAVTRRYTPLHAVTMEQLFGPQLNSTSCLRGTSAHTKAPSRGYHDPVAAALEAQEAATHPCTPRVPPPAPAPHRRHTAQDRVGRHAAQVERSAAQPRRPAILRAVAPSRRDECPPLHAVTCRDMP